MRRRYVEGSAVVFLFSLSNWLEMRATQKARTAISEVISLMPDEAELVGGGRVGVEQVQVGMIVAVKPGSQIPVDGVVVAGESFVNEAVGPIHAYARHVHMAGPIASQPPVKGLTVGWWYGHVC